MAGERQVHPDCINALNPYHECVEYCFRKIAEAKARSAVRDSEVAEASGSSSKPEPTVPDEIEESHEEGNRVREYGDSGDDHPPKGTIEGDLSKLTGRQKQLFELRLKMNEARKANQTAMVAEKKKMEAPPESRGMTKEKWFEERKKKVGKLLEANGLDMTKAYMLDTQEAAEAKYKKWEKDPAPFGWDGTFLSKYILVYIQFTSG
ncbi:hypothetical protein Cgig2_030293 [Carnegiea gigantea]|uniref:Pre-mRNA-splicing factor SYF2 n=1 Tax=Carnegiea gigantea TaxID=171969 RepID=A0A9Q1JMX7_9CARY|nr:hypothetical protein Cgig2_030293 [Carnegiea gigantea]